MKMLLEAPMRSALIVSVLALIGCANAVQMSVSGADLPVAALACPAHVEPGVAFILDGSASTSPTSIATIELAVSPGDVVSTERTGTFTVDVVGIATGRLIITDRAGNSATARCRIAVGDVGDVGDGGDVPGPADPVDPGEPVTPPAPPASPGTPVDLSGAFAFVAYDRPQLSGGVLDPGLQCGAAPSLALVDIVQQGTAIQMTMTTCSLSMPSVQIFALGVQDTQVPDAFAEAMPPIGPIIFDPGRIAVGERFAPPMSAVGEASVTGAALSSPLAALPSDPGAPNVVDSDGDGQPGVTIHSTFGDQQIVYRRTLHALSGTIVSADEIDGAAEGSFQADADSSLLSVFDTLVPTGQGLPSTFKMVRTSAQSCTDVRAQRAALLALLPAPSSDATCPSFGE